MKYIENISYILHGKGKGRKEGKELTFIEEILCRNFLYCISFRLPYILTNKTGVCNFTKKDVMT
jgi:hypothetical protein